MFAITKDFESLTHEMYPDDVIVYYNKITGVALIAGECYLSIYISREFEDNVIWCFAMEFSRGDACKAYKAIEDIEKHRLPMVMDEIRTEYPYKACDFLELSDAWGDGAIPF